MAFSYAPWCGHCKKLAPVWDQLAKKLSGGSIHIAKVDVTTNKELGERFGIHSFPTLLLFRDDKVYTYKGSFADALSLDKGNTNMHQVVGQLMIWLSL